MKVVIYRLSQIPIREWYQWGVECEHGGIEATLFLSELPTEGHNVDIDALQHVRQKHSERFGCECLSAVIWALENPGPAADDVLESLFLAERSSGGEAL